MTNIIITFLTVVLLFFILWRFNKSEVGLKGGLSSICFLLAGLISFNFYEEKITWLIFGTLCLLGGYFMKYTYPPIKNSK